MKRTTLKMDQELQILIYSIINNRFLKEILSVTKTEYFKLSYSKLVFSWIKEYYDLYKKAPGKDIQELYRQKRAIFREDESTDNDSIALFLQNLSNKYEEYEDITNLDFVIEQSIHYLKIRSGEVLEDEIKLAVLENDTNKLETVISNYKRVEKPTGQGVDLLNDTEKIKDAFIVENDILITFPGDLGKVIQPINRGDFVSYFGPAKRGKCEKNDTEILLSDGSLKRIDQIVKEKTGTILAMNNKYKLVPQKINEFYYNGIKDIYKIITRTGRKIEITSNHQLFTFSNAWQSLDEGLKIGSFIASPKNIPVFGNKNIPNNHVRLIAYLLADGGYATNSITYTKKDKIMMNDVIRIVESFNDKAIIKKNCNYSISITKGRKGPEKTFTKRLLIYYGIKNSKSIDKVIPNVIFTLSKELIKEFLMILFSGDGSIFKDGIQYSSGSEKLIRQIQHLLLRFGIVSKLDSKIAKINNREYYILNIRDIENIRLFINQIGFFGIKNEKAKKLIKHFNSKKRQRCYIDIIPRSYRNILMEKIKKSSDRYNKVFKNIIDSPNRTSNLQRTYLKKVNEVLKDKELDIILSADVLWDEIVSIEYTGKEKVYDIEVDKYHNFIANDIVTHNSHILFYTSLQALQAGNKVIHVTLEMTENEMIRRAMPALTGHPRYSQTIKYSSFRKNNEGLFDIVQHEKEKEGINLDTIDYFQKKIKRLYRKGNIRIIRPLDAIDVQWLETTLDNLFYYENYIPDVLVLDYADYMIPDKGFRNNENRERLNNIWVGLRQLAIRKNIAIVTASHTAKVTFETDIKTSHASEDIRKINNVTMAIGLNQTKKEKEMNIMRIGLMEIREGRGTMEQVVVTQCLDLGRPCLDSRLRSLVNYGENEEKEENYGKRRKNFE